MRELEDEIAIGRRLLGERLRERRVDAGLTRRQLSNSSGVAYDSLYAIEAGRRLANLSTLHRIANSLETTCRDLLAGLYPWDDTAPPTS